jgi:EAL domain-containing protein (putative c-di-GMP-specific phosphodiesterase class I)
MEKSLKRQEFFLHYQPQVDLQTGKTVSMEALLQWSHPELGLVSPSEFIAIAEESGHIIPMGRWVVEKVIADLPALLEIEPALRISTNFSLREISRPDFFVWLKNCLLATQFNVTQHLELEITESAFQQVPQSIIENLQSLRDLGLSIAMDDFGTGQSSLARLTTLPLDKIKLDRQFAQQLDQPHVLAVIQMVVSLAEQLNKTLVVEGPETTEACQTLIAAGCHLVQGYALGRPSKLTYWQQQGLPKLPLQ